MRFWQLSLAVLLAALFTVAYADNGKMYGKAITLKKVVKVSEIMASPAKFKGKKGAGRGKGIRPRQCESPQHGRDDQR